MAAFSDVISSEDALRDIIPAPRGFGVWEKSLTFIDPHAAAFIGKSPFAMIASSSKDGKMDISPKGDPPGFVRVVDENTLAIPDRPGNGRADTFRNILENPRISVYFLVPGRSETLRVNGSAQLVRDATLLENLAVKGKPAQLAIAINVEEAFFHCAKCVVRSNLWDTGEWDDASQLASLGQVMREQLKLHVDAAAIDANLQKDIDTRLY
jgi:PPOX class probable FMN-dependent enzyme